MRKISCSIGAFALLGALLGGASAQEDKEAQALVAKAVKAMGGEAKLAKLKAYTTKSEGKMFGPVEFSFTEEGATQTPQQFRFAIELAAKDQKFQQLLVFNGDKAWIKVGNLKPFPMPKDVLTAFQNYFHGLRFVVNPLELKKKGISLSVVGEVKIGDRAALGIRAAAKGRADVNLYFDKETGLPVKLELNAKDSLNPQAPEILHELFFTQYKEIDGVKVSLHMAWNKDGKKFLTREISELKPVDKIDPGMFAAP